jgi:hypothetical protein
MGARLPKNAVIVLQVHYAPDSKGQTDSTEVHFRYSDEPNMREVYMSPVLNHFTTLVNGPLYIPAGKVMTFKEKFQVPYDVSVLSVAPHMHLIGRNIKVYGITPQKDTLPLIKIDDWDFHWQGFYAFPRLKHITRGVLLCADAMYDNTENNPEQPNDPPKDVNLGEGTTDEMMLVYFSYMLYKPGDENIVLDSNENTAVQLNAPDLEAAVYPNPAQNIVHLTLNLQKSENISAAIFDLSGRQISAIKKFQQNAGLSDLKIPLDALPNGTYFVRIVTGERVMTRKLIIKR